MMTFYKSLTLVAAAAAVLVSCQKEIETPVDNNNAVTVNSFKFRANTENIGTKATLTPVGTDEASFEAAWTSTDVMDIYTYGFKGTTEFDEEGSAAWDATEEEFTATYGSSVTLPTEEYEQWEYKAWYPAKTDVPFANRTQNGNLYNSAYDLMYGVLNVDNALIGKNPNGTAIEIPMERLTAIAYYHITGGPDEDVVSATFTVDAGKVIAAEKVTIANDGASITPTNGTNTVTITFESGTAPKASDLQLWFNILTENIGSASSYNVTVDIVTTGHTARLTSKSARSFTAGKLNRAKINGSGLTWKTKAQEYTIEFINKTNKNVATLATNTSASTVIEASSLSYVTNTPFTTATNAYYGGDETNGLPLRIGKSSNAGEVAIALSDAGKVAASEIIVNAKQYSSGKTKTIGVNDSTKQQPGEDYGDLTFTLSGNDIDEIVLQTDGYIYVKYVKVIYTPKKTVTLSFPQSAYSIEEGESFTAPTLTIDPAGLTVTYSSSNESVAEVDSSTGTITLKGGVGATTITATYAGDDEYKSATASYTLTVTRAMSTSIAQMKTDLNGSTTEMEFAASLTNAIVTRKYSDAIAYIQDGTAGILVTDAADIEEGDSYSGTVTGKMVTANNQPKITELVVTGATKTTGATVTPEVVTIASLVSNMASYDGKLCKIVKAKAGSNLATGTNKSITISQGESSMTFFTRTSFTANTVVANNYYDIIGIPCKYNSTNEIVVVSTSDVADATLTWVLSSIAVKTAPTKTSYNAGECFDPTGLVLSTVEMDSDVNTITRAGEDVTYTTSTDGFSFAPSLSTGLTTENKSVTITYNGKSTTQDIDVVDPTVPTFVVTPVDGTTIEWESDEYGSGNAETITVELNSAATGYDAVWTSSSDWSVTDDGNGIITVYPVAENQGTTDADDKTLDIVITHKDDNTKTATITLKQNHQGGETEYEITMSSQTASNGVIEFTDSSSGIQFTFSKRNGSTAPTWNSNSSQLRLYAKGSLAITAPSGKVITQIVYTYTVNKSNSNKAPSINSVTGSSQSGTWTAATNTWSDSTGDSCVTMDLGGDAGNFGFTKITVTLK